MPDSGRYFDSDPRPRRSPRLFAEVEDVPGSVNPASVTREARMSEMMVLNGCQTIQLGSGFVALIDQEDVGIAKQFNWTTYKATTGLRYATTSVTIGKRRRRRILLHRFLVKAASGQWFDHKNCDPLDCRKENLRPCTPRQNSANARKTRGSSKYKGVYWDSRKNRWIASGRTQEGKLTRLGQFSDEKEAAKAYDRSASALYGDFARTNSQMFGDL
jgi:hypothetical protein